MFVHHLATIGLITFSYLNNMVRVGTLIMCLHDASDFFLEVSTPASTLVFYCNTISVLYDCVLTMHLLCIQIPEVHLLTFFLQGNGAWGSRKRN